MYRKVSKGLTEREVDGEMIVLDQETGEVHQLNPVAACIWEGLDTASADEELVDRIVDKFDIDVRTARQDVRRFLEELEAHELIEQVAL